ncbi:MAG: SDR family NAD(P)-dependent oxidoreductase [Rhodothermales bacterium]
MDLTNKVAVVTGASSGIGRAFSSYLADRGARVYGFARGRERLNEAAAEIGDAFHAIQCDVRDEEAVKAAFAEIVDDAGRLDVLINNAGLGIFGPVDEMSTADWEQQIDTNVTGVFLCTRAAVPHMKRQNAESGFGGYIINIASIAGRIGNPNLSAYNASKFAVRGFTESTMLELRGDGIKVTGVYPGSIKTDFSGDSGGGTTNPMTVDDIAGTIVHLLETDDNYLISEVVMRPLRPKG